MGIGRYAILASSLAALSGAAAGQGPGPAYDGDGVQQAGERPTAAPTLAPGHARAARGGRRRSGRVRQPDPDPLRQRGRVPPLSRRGAGRAAGAPGLVRRARAASSSPRPRPGAQSDTVEPICPETDPLCARPGRGRRERRSSPAAASRRRACGRRPRSPPSRSPTARSPTTRCATSRKATSSSRSTSICWCCRTAASS